METYILWSARWTPSRKMIKPKITFLIYNSYEQIDPHPRSFKHFRADGSKTANREFKKQLLLMGLLKWKICHLEIYTIIPLLKLPSSSAPNS